MAAAKIPRVLEEAEDRLSNLPESVIFRILSLLPTKVAATTAVLSKQWRFHFESCRVIDIDEGWQEVPKLERRRTRARFHEFVYRVLFTSELWHIHTFRLKCNILNRTYPVNDWLCAAIYRHVQELDLRINFRRFDPIAPEIFNCTTLRSLKLFGLFSFQVPNSVHLPNLVTLHLESIQLTDGSCLQRISSSPLQNLMMCNCEYDGDQVLQIDFPLLTNLILHRHFLNYKIALNAPKLECFEYCAYGPGFLIVKERMTSLIRADVDFEVSNEDEQIEPDEDGERAMVYGRYAKKIMNEFYHVKFLRLSGTALEVLDYSPCSWPSLLNLTSIELGVNPLMGWQPLPRLLESVPYLQELNFYEGFTNRKCSDLEFEYELPEIVPKCLSEHLRIIKIADFVGINCEFELVEYFLKNARVLQKMKITSETFWGWPSSFCERLLGYRNGLKACKIIVSWKIEENYCKRMLC